MIGQTNFGYRTRIAFSVAVNHSKNLDKQFTNYSTIY